jgi:hypothetical protein
MKRIKPSERHARTNQVVSITAVQTIRNQAANDKGSFSFLKSRPSVTRVERIVGRGRYLGDGRRVSAFVWLEGNEEEELKAA